MLAEFSIYPLDSVHLSGDVAKVVQALEEAGVSYRIGPLSTSIEGNLDEILSAIRRCHEAVAADHERVITTITIDDRRNAPRHLDEMVQRVEEVLGRSVPQAAG